MPFSPAESRPASRRPCIRSTASEAPGSSDPGRRGRIHHHTLDNLTPLDGWISSFRVFSKSTAASAGEIGDVVVCWMYRRYPTGSIPGCCGVVDASRLASRRPVRTNVCNSC